MKHNQMWKFASVVLLVLTPVLSLIFLPGQSRAQGGGIGAQAATGTAFTYQGQLVYNGSAVNGTCSLSFKLFDAAGSGSPPSGGTQVGSTVTNSSVSVSNGYFGVDLDFGSNAFTGDARWLQITINSCPGGASGVTLSPRVALNPAPYALSLRPGAVISSANIPISTLAGLYVQNNNTGTANSGIVGLAGDPNDENYGVRGQSYSTQGRGVYGYASNSGGVTYGVYGQSNSTSGIGTYGTSPYIGVKGEATATGGSPYGVYGLASAGSGVTSFGVYGQSNSSFGTGVGGVAPWNGVFGTASATSGTNWGVYGKSNSSGGYGVYGTAPITGVMGIATNSSGKTYGIYGKSSSATGYGVYGQNSALFGTGVYGTAPITGVVGIASDTSSISYGVYGETQSVSGAGVFGKGAASGVYGFAPLNGVYGESQTANGRGVYGKGDNSGGITYGVWGESNSPDGIGVYGRATGTSGINYGVYGTSDSPSGYAGYFDGRVLITGNLSKGSGSFKIDHPLDPENKYLYHSFVESPDMMNIYNGNVVLNENGEAWVELPDWFQALNRDFRYQLTPIGGFAPLYVAEEISGNRFKIAGGTPGLKVSWQVTGIRQDPYANANRIPVEEEKPPQERGTYLHPEAWGQPAEKGLDMRLQDNQP